MGVLDRLVATVMIVVAEAEIAEIVTVIVTGVRSEAADLDRAQKIVRAAESVTEVSAATKKTPRFTNSLAMLAAMTTTIIISYY